MRSLYLVLLTLLPALPPAAWADQARDDRWKQDLTFLSTELPKRHANLFFVMPRPQFDQAVSQLIEAIPTLSDAEVVTEMARIVAMAGDAHTLVSLTQTAAGFRSLPLSLFWFQDGLYVQYAAREYRQALATRVVQIGDKTAEEAYRLVSAVISHENESWLRAQSPSHLILPDLLQALKITSKGPPVRFTFEDAAQRRFSLDIDYLAAPVLVTVTGGGFVPLVSRNPAQPYWGVYLEDSRTLYFKYNRCVDLPEQPFAGFLERLFAAFDANPVDRLVVDLRNNPGGSGVVLDPFLDGMNARADRLATTRAYALFNRSTFSSAMLNAQDIKNRRDSAVASGAPRDQVVTLIGEPTGGNPTVPWRNGASFSLPNSKLIVNHTLILVRTTYQPGAAVDPDVLVPIYSYDGFARHDPVLAAVFADSKGDPPQEDSPIRTLNGASFRLGAPVAPGSLALAFGDFSGVDSGDAGTVPLPARIAATQLLVNDVAAPLVAVRPTQINFQVPAATPAGKVALRVVRAGNTVASGAMYVAPTAPGLFSTDALNPAKPGAILNEDSSINTETKPARAGEIIQIYATGQGATNPAVTDGTPGPTSPLARSAVAPRVYVGTAAAEVIFSGLSPQFPGLWQLNVKVPAGLTAGQNPVFVVAGTAPSNAVTLWIAAP